MDIAILKGLENVYYICLDIRVKRKNPMRQFKLPHQFHFILPQLLTKSLFIKRTYSATLVAYVKKHLYKGVVARRLQNCERGNKYILFPL